MYSSVVISGVHSSQFIARAVGAEGWAYIYDGYTSTYCHNGILPTGVLAGMSTPGGTFTSVTATAGSFTSGAHFIRYRYWNSQTGYPSPAGTQTAFTATADKKVAVYGMTASSDPRCDEIVLEMTEAGGTTFYRAAYISNVTRTAVGSAYLLSLNDDTLSVQLTPYTNTQDHSRPIPGSVMAYHKGFMFSGKAPTYTDGVASTTSGSTTVSFVGVTIKSNVVTQAYTIEFDTHDTSYNIASFTSGTSLELSVPAKATLSGKAYKMYPRFKNRVYVSESLYPESFDITRFAAVLRGRSDELVALVPYKQYLLVFGGHSLEVWQWDLDPLDLQDARITAVPGNRGAVNQDCIIEHDDMVYVLDYQGIYVYGGGARIRDITSGVRGIFTAINWNVPSTFHASADPINSLVMFHVACGPDTLPRHALVLDTTNGKWSMNYYDSEMRASATALDGYGQMRPLCAFRDAHIRYGGMGYAESLLPQGYIEQDTVASASTTSVAITNASKMYADDTEQTNWTYVGMPVYWENGKEATTIKAVNVSGGTALGFTVNPAFTSAPSAGDTLTFGRIHAVYKTKQFDAIPGLRMRDTVLSIQFAPVFGTKYLYVRVFEDGSTAPKTDWVASTAVSGVTFQANNAYIKVDLSTAAGVVHIPMQFEWRHSIQFEFSVREPNVPLRIYKYELTTDAEDDIDGY